MRLLLTWLGATALLALGILAVSAVLIDGSLGLPSVLLVIVLASFGIYGLASTRQRAATEGSLRALLIRREVELGRSSVVDELTGLASRREFETLLAIEYGRFQRHHQPTTLVMFQVVRAGETNTIAGSLMLSRLAAVVTRTLRSIDLACRFSDDVLAVLLLETDEIHAEIVQQRLRDSAAAELGGAEIAVAATELQQMHASPSELVRLCEQLLAENRVAAEASSADLDSQAA